MKTKCLSIVLLVMIGMLVFVSCGTKKYAGFEVEEGYIMLPYPEYNSEETFSFPLNLYKVMEKELKNVVDSFNKFDVVSEVFIEKSEDVAYYLYNLDIYDINEDPEYTKESLSEVVSDSELINSIMADLSNAPVKDLDVMDDFACFTSDLIDEFLYVLEDLYDYNEGDSYYDSKEEMFNDYIEEMIDSNGIELMNLYFPNVKVVTDYSKISK
ncbi:MAG: hypothetical protein J6B32_00645 [Spirochaetaceae bacterium]|nr:hypothetical protein [Spirochaetaceae bacterium]